MTRYHAHPNGYLTIDNDPTPVVEVTAEHWATHSNVILSELASDGNHAREWAARAHEIVARNSNTYSEKHLQAQLLAEMAEYHRDGQEGKR